MMESEVESEVEVSDLFYSTAPAGPSETDAWHVPLGHQLQRDQLMELNVNDAIKLL
jgi:hypothetical protein